MSPHAAGFLDQTETVSMLAPAFLSRPLRLHAVRVYDETGVEGVGNLHADSGGREVRCHDAVESCQIQLSHSVRSTHPFAKKNPLK